MAGEEEATAQPSEEAATARESEEEATAQTSESSPVQNSDSSSWSDRFRSMLPSKTISLGPSTTPVTESTEESTSSQWLKAASQTVGETFASTADQLKARFQTSGTSPTIDESAPLESATSAEPESAASAAHEVAAVDPSVSTLASAEPTEPPSAQDAAATPATAPSEGEERATSKLSSLISSYMPSSSTAKAATVEPSTTAPAASAVIDCGPLGDPSAAVPASSKPIEATAAEEAAAQPDAAQPEGATASKFSSLLSTYSTYWNAPSAPSEVQPVPEAEAEPGDTSFSDPAAQKSEPATEDAATEKANEVETEEAVEDFVHVEEIRSTNGEAASGDGSALAVQDAEAVTSGLASLKKKATNLTSTASHKWAVVHDAMRAYCTFTKDMKAPASGLAAFQHRDCSQFLCVPESCSEVEDDLKLETGSCQESDHAQWLVVPTPEEGVVGLKSLQCGRFVCIGGELPQAASAPGEAQQALYSLRLGPSSMSEEAHLSFVKGANSGSFAIQSRQNGAFVCLSDGCVVACAVHRDESVPAELAPEAAACWRISGLEPQASPEPTPGLDPFEIYSRFEGTVEQLIVMVMDPVLNGIEKVGIPPIREEARRNVAEHGSIEAAIEAIRQRIEQEEDASMSGVVMQKASELLLLRFMPICGSGAYLSYIVYSRLRLSALVAEIYGSDTHDPQVQSMLLFCISPSEDADNDGAKEGERDADVEESKAASFQEPMLRAAKTLSHSLARKVLKNATGWKTAADLYDLTATVCSEGYNRVKGGGDEGDQPEEKSAGGQQATFKKAVLLFKPSKVHFIRTATIVLLAFGAVLPILVSLGRHSLRVIRVARVVPLGVPVLTALLTILVVSTVRSRDSIYEYFTERPELLTSAVLVGHATLPVLGAFGAWSLLVDGFSRRLFAVDSDDPVAAAASGSGLLFLLVGTWSFSRCWQRCRAQPDTPTASGEPTLSQLGLLGAVALAGCYDCFGRDCLALHSLPSLGAFRSHHWLQGILQAGALECQLRLMILLRDRDLLLRLVGGTRIMIMAMALFLGGLTASVGFLVSRSEFSKFVGGLAPPPRVAAVVVGLRQHRALEALLIGSMAGALFQLPSAPLMVPMAKLLGLALGAGAVAVWILAFEEHREMLEDQSGSRWLLMMPDTSEKARAQASKVWTTIKCVGSEKAVEMTTTMLGKGVIDRVWNIGSSMWSAPLEKGIEGVVEVAAAAEKTAEAAT